SSGRRCDTAAQDEQGQDQDQRDGGGALHEQPLFKSRPSARMQELQSPPVALSPCFVAQILSCRCAQPDSIGGSMAVMLVMPGRVYQGLSVGDGTISLQSLHGRHICNS